MCSESNINKLFVIRKVCLSLLGKWFNGIEKMEILYTSAIRLWNTMDKFGRILAKHLVRKQSWLFLVIYMYFLGYF